MVVEIFLSRKNKKNILKFYFSWINFNLSLIKYSLHVIKRCNYIAKELYQIEIDLVIGNSQ